MDQEKEIEKLRSEVEKLTATTITLLKVTTSMYRTLGQVWADNSVTRRVLTSVAAETTMTPLETVTASIDEEIQRTRIEKDNQIADFLVAHGLELSPTDPRLDRA